MLTWLSRIELKEDKRNHDLQNETEELKNVSEVSLALTKEMRGEVIWVTRVSGWPNLRTHKHRPPPVRNWSLSLLYNIVSFSLDSKRLASQCCQELHKRWCRRNSISPRQVLPLHARLCKSVKAAARTLKQALS